MSTMIQAYFKTEDKAYQNEIELKKYDIDFVEVAPLNEKVPETKNFLVPIGAGMSTSGGPGYANHSGAFPAGRAAVGRMAYSDLIKEGSDGTEIEGDYFKYTLEAKVSDQDVEKAIQALRENEGHVAVVE
jgi:hypothetical protein